jgi:transposase
MMMRGGGQRKSQQHRTAAVMRILHGEDLETVAREVGVTAAMLTKWHDTFLAAGEAALEHDGLTTEGLEIERLKICLEEALSGQVILKKQLSAKADGEQTDNEATRTRIAAEVETLGRHYAADPNPLFVWKAIWLYVGWQLRDVFPEWVLAYLGAAARILVGMGEGLDWTTAPKPPPRGSDAVTVEAYIRQYSAWSQNLKLPRELKDPRSGKLRATAGPAWPIAPSFQPRKSGALVLKALGFSTAGRRNFFLDYGKTLLEQDLARRYLVTVEWQERMKRRGVPAHRLGSLHTLLGVHDPSNFSKRISKAKRSLERGRLEPEPGGPIGARLVQLWFRDS